MKKFDGKHRKRIGRKKREALAWRQRRAQARKVRVKKMINHIATRSDPLRYCVPLKR